MAADQTLGAEVTSGSARGAEQVLDIAVVVRPYGGNAVRAQQVVAEALGKCERALFARARQELVHQIAPQPQLDFRDGAQSCELDREHRRAVLERRLLPFAGGSGGIDEREHAQEIVVRTRDREQTITIPDRLAGRGSPSQHRAPNARRRLGVRNGRALPGPRAQVPVPVLDDDGVPGQIVYHLRDDRLVSTGDCDLGEARVDCGLAFEGRQRLREHGVRIAELLDGIPFAIMQPRVGERDPGLLSKQSEQKQVGRPWLVCGGHDDIAEGPAEASQRKRERPLTGIDRVQRDRPTRRVEAGDLIREVRDLRGRARDRAPAGVQVVGAAQDAAGERRNRGRKQGDDLRLVAALGHQHQEREHVPQAREFLTPRRRRQGPVHPARRSRPTAPEPVRDEEMRVVDDQPSPAET